MRVTIKYFEREIERLRSEIGDYRPEAFEHITKRFIELYRTENLFRRYARKDFEAGKCPVKEWLSAHNYPTSNYQVQLLRFFNMLTAKSQEQYIDILKKYLFKLKNSEIVRKKNERLRKQGVNPFALWMARNNFKPVFRDNVI